MLQLGARYAVVIMFCRASQSLLLGTFTVAAMANYNKIRAKKISVACKMCYIELMTMKKYVLHIKIKQGTWKPSHLCFKTEINHFSWNHQRNVNAEKTATSNHRETGVPRGLPTWRAATGGINW
jgi:hypothetical protein